MARLMDGSRSVEELAYRFRLRGAHEVLWRPVQLVQMQPGDGDRNGDCGGSGKVMVLVVVVMVVVVVVVVIATGCSPWRGGAAVELLQHTYCGSTCSACCGRAAAVRLPTRHTLPLR